MQKLLSPIKFFCTVAISFLLLTSHVFADQATVLTYDDAKVAVNILKEQKTILDYCEPCSSAKKEVKIKTVEMFRFKPEDPRDNYWVIRVNGEKIDLAYTFLKRKDYWENLAMLFNIDVSDVSYQLPIKEKKTRKKKKTR